MKTFEIFIPSKDLLGEPLPESWRAAAIAHTEWKLLEISRGFTRTESIGAYVDSHGVVIRESVTIYKFFAPNDSAVRPLAEYLCVYLQQETLLFTENGTPNFVSVADESADVA